MTVDVPQMLFFCNDQIVGNFAFNSYQKIMVSLKMLRKEPEQIKFSQFQLL